MEMNNRLMSYWNMMRGAVRTDDYITTAVLLDEVKKRLENTNAKVTVDDAYAVLLEVADELRVRNPFTDKDRFNLMYQEALKYKKVDWEGAIAQMASASRMPTLPKAIIDVYRERFDIKPDTILIAEAEKFVPNLMDMVDANINSRFVLTTQNTAYARALENVFEGYENVQVLVASIYTYEFTNQRFDLIFACPAFGGRTLADDKTFMCREFDMVALENLSLHLNTSGRLVITLPGRITFASGKVDDLRQFIQISYTIREIAELPEGSLESTGIKIYLLDIENTRPGDDDIVIRKYAAVDRKTKRAAITKLEVADDTFVMLDELIEQGDWSIDRIFSQQDEEYLNFQASGTKKDLLGNVAQVFRGKAVNKKEPAGSIGVVNISNIGDYEIDYDGLDHLQEEERKVSNYILQDGDVVLPARGTVIRTAVFRSQSYPCIASSNVIVIRPDAKMLDSIYLKIFLDSPVGNKMISGAQQGTTVMNISYKDLNVLEVPVPSLKEQQKIAKEYIEELQKYNETVNAATKRWNDVLTKLQKF